MTQLGKSSSSVLEKKASVASTAWKQRNMNVSTADNAGDGSQQEPLQPEVYKLNLMNKQLEEAQYSMNLRLSHNHEVKKDKIIELIGYITKGAKHMSKLSFSE